MLPLWPASLLWLLGGYLGVFAAVDQSAIRRIPLRSHSLQSPYLDSDMQSRYFEFGDDTIVRADQYIRLTSNRQGQSGWLFSRMPMTATNWQIEVEFKIHSDQGHLHGDGLAIWLIEERARPGKVFGHMDHFHGLGVFIDTYKNQRPSTTFPYVMAMLGNGTQPYDKDHDGKDNELAGCSARGIRASGTVPTKIKLTYYTEQSLRVDLQYKAVDEWTECFETEPLKLPQTVYLGFSAETGELTDNHDIISVSSQNLHVRQKPLGGETEKGQSRPYNPGGTKETGGWRWFFLKIILLGVVLVGSYVGWTIYRTSRRGSRF